VVLRRRSEKVVDLALSVLFNQRLNLLGTPLPKVNEL
jgi:hypothetical protein